jgi:ferritin-like protein
MCQNHRLGSDAATGHDTVGATLVKQNSQEKTMSSDGYHEPINELSVETRDMHRAIVSLMEELEAVDWYNQRADACKDPELKAILQHNRDEEKEHASMVLEWIRRRDPKFDTELRDWLFTDKKLDHH